MHFLGLVSLGGKVRWRKRCAVLAREEEMAALPRHPSTRSGEEAWEIRLLGGRNGSAALRVQKGYRR
ncbi:unnamed protein product [Spirodela intermedia]|uniref:Uncharacterized protein n=2 Tax=Spirodela intermedia TaxID=51605 RepID=A0A7I8K656_SPIIN|nr:unnamed protein product [Spirodela intermedia]CAA6656517.1 unnamed protein product [Spirodela intermedia]CAA7392105.1 unnamed protein product [Spirodela intermedia]